MTENRFVVTVRDDIVGKVHRLRIDDRVLSFDVGRFLALLGRKYGHRSGLTPHAFVEGRPLDPSETVAEALRPCLDDIEVAVRVTATAVPEADDVDPPLAAEAATDVREVATEDSGDTSSAQATESRAVAAVRIANTLLSLLGRTPARFHEKNRRILDRTTAQRSDFARMGPILVNWCDDDFARFDEGERRELIETLVWFVRAAAEDPQDAAYSAVLAVSHVPGRLPWDDESFRVVLSTVVQSLPRHVRGGEGTAHVQRALGRLKGFPGLPDDVRKVVEDTHGSLWKGLPDVDSAESASLGRDERDEERRRSRRERDRGAQRDPVPDMVSRSRGIGAPTLLPPSRGKVALLIDLENLIYGLRAQYGDDQVTERMNYGALYRFAREFGDVSIVNAYADWKYRIMNQFQRDLYNHGVELVHVIGKGRRNAADLRMAIDLTAMLWTHPEIEVFVIVSGDRDFIEILKELRRRGKRVVGIANHYSINRDFALLFDFFASYKEVCRRFGKEDSNSGWGELDRRQNEREVDTISGDERSGGESRGGEDDNGAGGSDDSRDRSQAPRDESRSDLQDVRTPITLDDVADTLRQIFVENGNDLLKGARIKPLLRSKLGNDFHERDLGYSSMSALLRALPAVARVYAVKGGGDVFVLPADSSRDAAAVEDLFGGEEVLPIDPLRALVKESGLGSYRFETDRVRRREILATIHDAITAWATFTWEAIYEKVRTTDAALSPTIVSRYQSILYQSGMFAFEQGATPGDGIPLKKRPAKVSPQGELFEGFMRAYEKGVVSKALEHLGHDVGVDSIRGLLGFVGDGFEVDDEGYCEALIEEAKAASASSDSDDAEEDIDSDLRSSSDPEEEDDVSPQDRDDTTEFTL
jgi:uncharacterized LabA/DUF88 family protein